MKVYVKNICKIFEILALMWLKIQALWNVNTMLVVSRHQNF